jgi:hypothetical protein
MIAKGNCPLAWQLVFASEQFAVGINNSGVLSSEATVNHHAPFSLAKFLRSLSSIFAGVTTVKFLYPVASLAIQ